MCHHRNIRRHDIANTTVRQVIVLLGGAGCINKGGTEPQWSTLARHRSREKSSRSLRALREVTIFFPPIGPKNLTVWIEISCRFIVSRNLASMRTVPTLDLRSWWNYTVQQTGRAWWTEIAKSGKLSHKKEGYRGTRQNLSETYECGIVVFIQTVRNKLCTWISCALRYKSTELCAIFLCAVLVFNKILRDGARQKL